MGTTRNDDLFTPEVINDPYTYFGRLREEDPVHWNEKYEVWIITSYEDLVWIARHPELFSSEVFKRDHRPPYPPIDESDLGLYEAFRNYQTKRFIQHDRPEHTAMRMVVHGYFTPKYVESWRPLVQSAIKYLLDAAEEKGRMDVMADFATPLPVLVIAKLMGIPDEDRPFIRQWAKNLLFAGRGESDRMRQVAQGIQEFYEYLPPLLEERLVAPKEDLLSVLVSGEKQGVYTRDEVMSNAVLLLQAGHETTINLLCNGTLAFIRHPDQWALLKQDPAGRVVRATEECLRYDAPVKSIQRIAAEDVELQGKRIRKNDRVRWFISSANRDPGMFPEPDRFDIARYPNSHVAFGSGIHHCLGATLARLEGQEGFKALAERFPSLHVETEELEYQPSITFRSLKSLPVAWG
jgi:cytochrome P450